MSVKSSFISLLLVILFFISFFIIRSLINENFNNGLKIIKIHVEVKNEN